jgi:hypothetical protein
VLSYSFSQQQRQCWFCLRAVNAVFGIIVPICVFLLSMLLAPEWKGGAKHGWIDSLHYGKIVLLPLALWASAALYAIEVWRVQHRTRPWIVLGILLGSLVSLACLLHGLFVVRIGRDPVFMLLIPLYTAIWYTFRAIELIRKAEIAPLVYLKTLTISLPFWIGSVMLAKKEYLGLPNEPPDCFVVSAAMNGHERIVRPFLVEDSSGRQRQVNRQLLRFRQFEMLWTTASPRTHGWFRRMYNAAGPVIAAQIRTAWVADLMYLLLKPAELAAWLLLRFAGR